MYRHTILRQFTRTPGSTRITIPSISRSISTSTPFHAQNTLPASYYRGGTSRAIFFQHQHLPPSEHWPPIFLGVLGSPDPYGRQLDGMGGGISSLSKICVVGPSTSPEADVDYTFAAVGVRDSDVDLSGNCGNMTSAVGPFAVDKGLFRLKNGAGDGEATVRICNTNTGKIIHSTFQVSNGEAETRGDFAIDGVAGTAARVKLEFIDPAGSKTGELTPTGSVIDVFDGIETTCVDVGNPGCFVAAEELGVYGGITPNEIEQHPTLLKQLDSIRRQAGVKMGLAKTVRDVPASIPKIGLVSTPSETEKTSMDLRIRAISVGQPHKAVPITVALALAAAAKIPGSVVQRRTPDAPVHGDGIVLGHASGKLMVGAKFDEQGRLTSASVFRTARRLMDGNVYWK